MAGSKISFSLAKRSAATVTVPAQILDPLPSSEFADGFWKDGWQADMITTIEGPHIISIPANEAIAIDVGSHKTFKLVVERKLLPGL